MTTTETQAPAEYVTVRAAQREAARVLADLLRITNMPLAAWTITPAGAIVGHVSPAGDDTATRAAWSRWVRIVGAVPRPTQPRAWSRAELTATTVGITPQITIAATITATDPDPSSDQELDVPGVVLARAVWTTTRPGASHRWAVQMADRTPAPHVVARRWETAWVSGVLRAECERAGHHDVAIAATDGMVVAYRPTAPVGGGGDG